MKQETKKRKNVQEIAPTTASHALEISGIRPDSPTIICGKHSKSFPIVRQLTKINKKPFLLLGTKRDLPPDSCLRSLNVECFSKPHLSPDNGMLILSPSLETILKLKDYIPNWDTHFLVICLGNGLQLDLGLLNILNTEGEYIILTESLARSVKGMNGCELSSSELLSAMDYILVSSIGTAAKDFINMLPFYECEKITNTSDFSLHQDSPQMSYKYPLRNRNGFRISQSRTLETKPILTQDDLRKFQDNNLMLIHNARLSYTWITKIVR